MSLCLILEQAREGFSPKGGKKGRKMRRARKNEDGITNKTSECEQQVKGHRKFSRA